MILRIMFALTLLPVLIVVLPLMFTLAWLHEVIDDLKPKRIEA